MSVLTPSPGTAGDAGGAPALACYLALDTSDSMAGAALDAAGDELARLWDAARRDPRLAACCVGLISFDAEARVHAPLTPATELGRPPRPAATRPATDYEAAFTLLRAEIGSDLAALRARGRYPRRPVVFLLTDGRPTRGCWPPAHAALTGPGQHDVADVVAFGFGNAAEAVVRRIGTAGAYLPAGPPGARAPGPAGMLATFTSFLLAALGGSLADPGGRLALPRDAPTGWRALPAPPP